jgi:hypothetical protein
MPTYKGVCRENATLRAAACTEEDGGGFENLASFDGDMFLQKISVVFFNNTSRREEIVQELSFIPYVDLL